MDGIFNWNDVSVVGECVPAEKINPRTGYGVIRRYEKGGYQMFPHPDFPITQSRAVRKYVAGRRHTIQAHRQAWAKRWGRVPEKRVVMHLCNNRSCINPDHLRLGTMQENTDHMYHCGRRQVAAGCPTKEGKYPAHDGTDNWCFYPE